jgi:very-short-patch-repair endonuclease
VNPKLSQLIGAGGGVVRRRACLKVVEHHVLDRALESGQVIRALPETYLTPAALADRHAVIRAAAIYSGAAAAASHLTALELWRLPVPPQERVRRIHLMTNEHHHPRGAPGVVVHRRRGFTAQPPDVAICQGIPVTSLETSIVDSWPLLEHDAKRAPAIEAVAQRMTTPQGLSAALDGCPRLGGRRHLAQLIARLAAGCRSPLEIWGYDHVFSGPGMTGFVRQRPVLLAGRTVYLDVFDERSRINFELDGTKYHGSPQQREADLRRDTALAALGIVVVRFTHNRLVYEAPAVRREVLEILRAHRRR